MTKFAFHHVALSVSDVDRSASFYEQFGFEVERTWRADDGSLTILHLWNGTATLELFGYRDYMPLPPTSRDLGTDLTTIGTKHFGLHVEDIHAVYDEFRAAGAPIASELRMGRTGIEYFFLRDPDGILFEVVQETAPFFDRKRL